MPSFVVTLDRVLEQRIHIAVNADDEGQAFQKAQAEASLGGGEWLTKKNTVELEEVRQIEDMEVSSADLLVQMLTVRD